MIEANKMDINDTSIELTDKFVINRTSIVGVLYYRGHTLLILKSGSVFELKRTLKGYLSIDSDKSFFNGALNSLWHKDFISCVTLTPHKNQHHEFNVLTAKFNDGKVVSLRLKPETVEFQRSVLFPTPDFVIQGVNRDLLNDAPTTDEGWIVQ